MTTILKVIWAGITGGLADAHSDLQARFMAWLVFTLISLGAFTFDAWISYSVFADYLAYIGSAGNIPGLILSTGFALSATVSAGVVAYVLVAWRRAIPAKEKLTDSLRFAGIIAGFLYLTFAAVSVLANVQGAQQAAELSAEQEAKPDDSRLTATTQEWTNEKQQAEVRYDNELAELKGRIAAIEAGTSVEQGRVNGMRGNATYKGAITKYGRALLADLRTQIIAKEAERAAKLTALDTTYQTRLNTETAAFNRVKGKYNHRKEKATTAIRLIVFLIYPIALLIAIFNAHFLHEVIEVLPKGESVWTRATKRKKSTGTAGYSTASSRTTARASGFGIGYKPASEMGELYQPEPYSGEGFESFDKDEFKQELLQEISTLLEAKNRKVSPVKGDKLPPSEHRFSSTHQPDRSAPKKHGQRADGVEARTAILAAYRAIETQRIRPTYKAISKATRYSEKTVGNHIRELRRENIL